MTDGIFEKVKDGVIGAVRGTGDVVGAIRGTVTTLVVGTLKDAGEITSTALGVVTDAVRGALRGPKKQAPTPPRAPVPSSPALSRPWFR
jgi:hypothetical protein